METPEQNVNNITLHAIFVFSYISIFYLYFHSNIFFQIYNIYLFRCPSDKVTPVCFTNVGTNEKIKMHETLISHGVCLKCLGMEETWSIKFRWVEHVQYNMKNFMKINDFVGGDTPICAVKYYIAGVIGDSVNPDDVTLLYRGVALDDDVKTLQDYGIPRGFIIMNVKHKVTDFFGFP